MSGPPQLDLLRPVLAALERPLGHDADEVRTRAEELLSRPPYDQGDPGWLARALEWLGEVIARVLQVIIEGIAATGTAGAWALVVIGALALAAVVWRLTRGTSLDRHAPQLPASVPSRTAASWRSEAQQHERADRLREALRCWYAALVASLHEEAVVEDVPGMTVRELDREIRRAAPELHPAVVAAGARFESVVFGRQPATREDLAVVRDAVDAIAGARR